MCLSVRVSVRHISGTACPILTIFFVIIAYRFGSVLPWRPCDTLSVSRFVDDVILAPNGPSRRVALLSRRAQANAAAASYWLRRVSDTAGAEAIGESIVQAVQRQRRLANYRISISAYRPLSAFKT